MISLVLLQRFESFFKLSIVDQTVLYECNAKSVEYSFHDVIKGPYQLPRE